MSPHTCQNGYHQKEHITNVGENVEEREHCWRECKSGSATVENSMETSKKLKIELTYDPAIPLLVIDLKKNRNTNLKRYTHPKVHSSVIYNCQGMDAT